MPETTTTEYWEHYYAELDLPDRPSNFAQFVGSRFPEIPAVLELGAGNGRDAALWHAEGRYVIAVDQSMTALEKCREMIGDSDNTSLVAGSVDAKSTWDEINKVLAEVNPKALLVYGRFFFHAIPEDVEDFVLSMLPSLGEQYNATLCFEFRTVEDRNNPRATAEHYRRYIDPKVFNNKLEQHGFQVDYFVEGLGYAKYKEDNAYVARVLATVADVGSQS